MKVKICGITNLEDALLCEELTADALGFIFYEKSKRYVAPETVEQITEQIDAFILKVGVFVNEQPDRINSIAKSAGLNIVQLHGDETPEIISQINLPVIKAFRVNEQFDFETLNNYKNCYYLLDTFSKSEYGGTGKSFDWNLIPTELRSKIILSGGISSSNIQIIKTEINPYAVDVSSSLEEYPGKKSKGKLKEFFNKIRNI